MYLNRCNVAVMFEDEGLQSVGLNRAVKFELGSSCQIHTVKFVIVSHLSTVTKHWVREGIWMGWGNQARLTTGSVGWKTLKSLLQMEVGKIWSWWQLVPGRIPLRAKNTAKGDPMQKKFSTWEAKMQRWYDCLKRCLVLTVFLMLQEEMLNVFFNKRYNVHYNSLSHDRWVIL